MWPLVVLMVVCALLVVSQIIYVYYVSNNIIIIIISQGTNMVIGGDALKVTTDNFLTLLVMVGSG